MKAVNELNLNVEDYLVDFLQWVDNNTYLLDGERYWDKTIHGTFTELVTQEELAEKFIDNLIKNMEHKSYNDYPYGNEQDS